ncbi:hypothetical protein MKW98_019863 [Papaver atlanticum]|uniref:Uncharacterized protein n=1 Tax=Papaver atlanticum TaxID=357466 RepID=A0AAD4X655_9MAGN|nr:hypothetical protein MKW98_019863 [Papaver atlanticum]
MNWAVVDKYALHEKMKPWISNIARNSLDEEADDLVSQILESLDNHGSASSVLQLIMSLRLVNEVESEKEHVGNSFLQYQVFREKKKPLGVEIFNVTPKTKEEVLSLDINWVIFDQHDLRETMRPWIREEVMKLLKKEKASVVDQVVDSMKKQIRPSRMLEVLEPSWAHAEMVVRILWKTLLILVKILETEDCGLIGVSSFLLFTSYLNCYPSLKRSFSPFSKLDLQHFLYPYPVLIQTPSSNRLGNAIPRNVENFSSFEVDWAVSDRVRLLPWLYPAPHALSLLRLDPFPDIVRERLGREKVKISQYGDRFGRNRHFIMVSFDYENLLKLKQISQAMPKTKEELFSSEIKWDVYEKHGLQKSMRKGIWIETLELIRKRKESMLVDEQIMWSIFDYHVSASQRELSAQEEALLVFEELMLMLHKYRACPSKMLEYLEPILGSGSEKFVMRMWYAVMCGIKLAESRVAEKCEGRSHVLLPRVDCQ